MSSTSDHGPAEGSPVDPAIDAVVVEAVLARAAALSGETHAAPDIGLTAEQLSAAAAEVGISPAAVAAALAEARVGVDEHRSLTDRIIGPRRLWGRRSATEPGDRTDVVEAWLRVGHGMRTWTRDDGVVVAGRRRDLAGKITSTVRRAQGHGRFGVVEQVEAVSVQFGDEPAVVCVMVDAANKRNEAVVVGSVVAGVGAATVGLVVLVTSPLALVGLPVVAGFGAVVSRFVYRPTVRDLREELAVTLDGISRGEQPPSMLDAVTGRLRRRT